MADFIHSFSCGAYNNSGYGVSDAYSFSLEVTILDKDLVGNKTQIRVELHIKGNGGFWYTDETAMGYYVYGAGDVIGTDNYNMGGPNRGEKILNETRWINHNADGTKTINFRTWVYGSKRVNYLPRDFEDNWNCALPVLDRYSTVVIDPKVMIEVNTPLSITVTRKNTSFYHTVEWRVKPSNGSWIEGIPLATKVATKNFSIPFNTIVAKLGSAYLGDIQVRALTYDGTSSSANQIGKGTESDALVSATIKTGLTPLALYDDMGGNVGVTLAGIPKNESGVGIKDDGPFEPTSITYKDGSGNNKTIVVLAKRA